MNLEKTLSDAVVLEELGRRIVRRRLDFGLTQAVAAEEAGVSKRTLERLESGADVRISTFIRVLRVLNLMDGLDGLVPEVGIRPMEMLKLRGAERKRASSGNKKRSPVKSPVKWHWGDDE